MTPSGARIDGRPLVAGDASGPALVLTRPLSIAGGLSLETGRVIDIHVDEHGALMTGHVLVMPVGRGSSTSSTVLAESLRTGVGPAAIVLPDLDQILVLGAIVARTLYDVVCPIVVADVTETSAIKAGDDVSIHADGTIDVLPPGPSG